MSESFLKQVLIDFEQLIYRPDVHEEPLFYYTFGEIICRADFDCSVERHRAVLYLLK